MNLKPLTSKIIEASFYALFIIVPLILTPYNYELFEFNKMLTVYALTVIIASAWIIQAIANRKLKFQRTPFDIPFILFFLSQLLSTIFSIEPRTSLWGYYSRFHGGLVSAISYLILFYAYSTHMKTKTKTCLKVIFSTALLISLYAIAEHFGIDKNVWVQDVQNRVFSTLGQPNWLAAYLLTLIPLTLAFKPPVYLLLTATLYLALLYTKSRSGLLGLAVAYFIFWSLNLIKKNKTKSSKTKSKKTKLKQFLIASALLGSITLLIGTDYTPSLTQLLQAKPPASTETIPDQDPTQPAAITLGGSKSSEIRKVVWQGALDIWKANPILGSGVETFAYSYYNHRPIEHNLLSEWDFIYNKAHNEFLNFLATTGLFGLLSYSSIILWFTIWSLKQKPTPILIALLAGFIGLAVSNFFGFSVVPVALFFFLWPALALDLTRGLKSTKSPTPKTYPIITNQDYLLITLTIFLSLFLEFKLINWWRADFFFSRGRDYAQLNQLTDSHHYLSQAVKLMPQEPLFRAELAETQTKLALAYHQQLSQQPAELQPQIAASRDQLITQALTNIDLVTQQNPVHLNFWKNRIQILLLLYTLNPQYQPQLLDAFNQAINLAPTDPKLRYNLALLYSQLNQTGLAEQIFLETINLKPNYEAARFALGSLYQQTNRPEPAREQYQYILDYLNPGNQKVLELLQTL